MKNGVISEEVAKVAPVSRCIGSRCAVCRKANPTPRSTMPSRDRLSGTNSAVMMAANAGGNAVHSSTRMKTSRHVKVGLPDRGDRLVDQLPRARAALRAARHQVPHPAAEVGPAE